ncbi:Ribosomal lysine N-methyltransferase set10 [Madurella mycetomatis]|uniref:Ribosomal lysine N-methyltransferase set10 n=1 Tax=Madurella mycetomatis TaxID=100816 RepID=A0A175VPX1_9PEZI|nr:Ribosomal lysine N-methyltransferase set10 [Madurella mycetomatis]
MKESDQARFKSLVTWACNHGAELHPSLEVYHDNVSKFSLRVKNSAAGPLGPNFTAVTCPVPITLSYLNALIDDAIEISASLGDRPTAFSPRFMSSIPPHAIGRFFLIKEYLKGKDSRWWPYIATLPQPENLNSWVLPAFWPEDDTDFLEGTNAYAAVQEIQENVKREFKQARRVLKDEGFPNRQDYTQLLYKWAFCIFTSRSFRPSLVLSQSVREYASTLLPAGCGLDDFSILQPLFDIANHSMTAKFEWDIASDQNCCRLICGDAYQPGDQVYNNYGLKSNSELLLAYGVILPEVGELHNDYLHIRKRQRQDDGALGDEPKDFLISLRPMSHPSSLVGRARSLGSTVCPISSLSAFAHFEPALVEDLAFALASPDEKQIMESRQSSGGERLLEELAPLVQRIKEALAGKLQYDYQRLKEVSMGEGESQLQPANRNQELAVDYRRQCERVLLAAMRGLEYGTQSDLTEMS